MSDRPTDRDEGADRYVIRVRGHLAGRWADWFHGFTLRRGSDGTTVLDGVVDQAALHGVLRQLADLGLPLVSVTPITPDACTGTATTDLR